MLKPILKLKIYLFSQSFLIDLWKYIEFDKRMNNLLNSYSLMFFSLNNVFAAIILLVTFFSPVIGLCGFLAVALINVSAYIMGFNRDEIKTGLFGFNALFLGLSVLGVATAL